MTTYRLLVAMEVVIEAETTADATHAFWAKMAAADFSFSTRESPIEILQILDDEDGFIEIRDNAAYERWFEDDPRLPEIDDGCVPE
jgi:hypothetical protein